MCIYYILFIFYFYLFILLIYFLEDGTFLESVIPNAEVRKRETKQDIGTSGEKRASSYSQALLNVSTFGCFSFSLSVTRMAPWSCALISTVSPCAEILSQAEWVRV